MTSFTDFLTIIPPGMVVHEKFWQTKDDVNGMLATSYLKLASTDAVRKAIVWGELRADDLTYESSKSMDDKYTHLVMATVDYENEFTQWGIYYEAINYAKGRVQFGKPISKFQNTQFVLAEMATRCEIAQLLTYRAASVKDSGKRCSKEAAMAKLTASETAMWATTKAVQLHGGYGYTREYPVERMMRDAKITEIYEGTSEVQRMVISGAMLKK